MLNKQQTIDDKKIRLEISLQVQCTLDKVIRRSRLRSPITKVLTIDLLNIEGIDWERDAS